VQIDTQITLGDVTIDVVRKKVRNINLTVHPPLGEVRISAPRRASLRTIRAFAISKLDWIRKQQAWMREQARQAPVPARRGLEYVDGETHFVWGRRRTLLVWERDGMPSVESDGDRLVLRVRPGTDRDGRRAVIEAWHRSLVQSAVPPLVARWEPRLGVKLNRFQVRPMKTRWGSCTPSARTIRLNAELAVRPPKLLEYIVVHELVHLLEPSHNERFHSLMDRHMPGWRTHRDALNREPEQGGRGGDANRGRAGRYGPQMLLPFPDPQ